MPHVQHDLFFFIQPIKSLICGVVVDVASSNLKFPIIKFVVHDRIDHIHIHFLLIVDLRSPTNTDSWAVSAPSHVVHYEVSFTSLHSKIQFGYTSFSLTANVCDNTATTKLASHRNMRAVHVQNRS